MFSEELKETLLKEVKRNNLNTALKLILKSLEEDSSPHIKASEIKSRLSKLNADRGSGILDSGEYDQSYNQIRKSLSDFINNKPSNQHPNSKTQKTVLLLYACPQDLSETLAIDQIDAIQKALVPGDNSQRYLLKSQGKVQKKEIPKLLLENPADILHICVHASKTKGFIFEDGHGQRDYLSAQELKTIMSVLAKYDKRYELIILTACNSSEHAFAVQENSAVVISMNDFIGVQAATCFTKGFYDMLFAKDTSIPKAFDAGILALALENFEEEAEKIPEIYLRPQ